MSFKSFVVALSLGLAATAVHAEGTLKLGTEGAYPPFNFIDSAGNVTGFDVEIGQALCAKMEVQCEVVAQDWDGIIPGLLAKKYDFIIASMFITEERKQQVNFTDPYYKAAMTVVAPKETDITDFTADGLEGKLVGVQVGTTQADYAHKVFTKSEIREYPTQDEVNLDLASGRIDLQVGDMLPMLEWTQKTEDGACCELKGEPITDPAFVGDGVGIAIRKEDTDLLAKMNEALKAIREDGTYKAINDKYFPIDVYTMT
jgi:polar amino acid transport system substrate-binding protein